MHNAGLYSVKTTSRVTWHFGGGPFPICQGYT